MTRAAPLGLAAALAVALGTLAPAVGGEPPTRCGLPGVPPCPLQHFMRTSVAAPLAIGDARALARAFDQIDGMNPRPAKWQNWSRFAKDGAAAARSGELGKARASCGSCHRIYRRQYNFEMRDRALPAAPVAAVPSGSVK